MQTYNTEFESPKLTGFQLHGHSAMFTYTRFNHTHRTMPSPAQLAAALKELGAIEGYDVCNERHTVMVLHTTSQMWMMRGELVEVPGYDGEPLHKWLAREMNDTIAQCLCNHHENNKDLAMLKSHLAETLDALKLGGTAL